MMLNLLARKLEENSIPEPNSGCLLWTAAGDNHGYGMFYHAGKMVRAHRAAYEATHGPIPQGLQVLHRCDVRACVNAGHLFLGTNADNRQDQMLKGRSGKKMTAERVREMRGLRATGVSAAALGQQYSISPSMVRQIVRNRVWKHT